MPTHFLAVFSKSNTLVGLTSWKPLQGMTAHPNLVVVREAFSPTAFPFDALGVTLPLTGQSRCAEVSTAKPRVKLPCTAGSA